MARVSEEGTKQVRHHHLSIMCYIRVLFFVAHFPLECDAKRRVFANIPPRCKQLSSKGTVHRFAPIIRRYLCECVSGVRFAQLPPCLLIYRTKPKHTWVSNWAVIFRNKYVFSHVIFDTIETNKQNTKTNNKIY